MPYQLFLKKTPMTTIKAIELRIGNWVSGVNSYKKIDHLDIRDVAENRLIVPFIPIPLTEEILLKAGFKSREASTCNEYYIGTNEVTQDWLFSLVWLHNPERINAPNAPFYRNGRHTIYYLHQLQNLYFALTGQELEINL